MRNEERKEETTFERTFEILDQEKGLWTSQTLEFFVFCFLNQTLELEENMVDGVSIFQAQQFNKIYLD